RVRVPWRLTMARDRFLACAGLALATAASSGCGAVGEDAWGSASALRPSVSITFADLSAGHAPASGRAPSPVIDEVNRALVVVTEDGSNGSRPGLFRCSLDGTGCEYKDISAGEGEKSGRSPSAIFDRRNRKLLVVTSNFARDGKPGLFRCDADGTNC